VTYFELAHQMSHAKIRLLWIGGILYTIGAILKVLNWPTLLPGVFGPHEVFHLFVMAGTACHYYFMFVHLAPYRRPIQTSHLCPVPAEPMQDPRPC
jgi:hemolysin III